MKRRLFHLSLICLLIGLFSVVASAGEVFSVTADFKNVGIEVLKQAGSQVSGDGFILVPEPSSILLLGSGILALLRYRSKFHSRKDE